MKLNNAKNFIILSLAIMVIIPWITSLGKSAKDVLGINYTITQADLLDKINSTRKTNGLKPLTLNMALTSAAEQKTQDMVSKNYFAHFSPGGTAPWSFIKDNNYKFIYAGENLARGYSNADEVITAWMNSASHKKNILSTNYTETGFAITSARLLGQETTVIVEMFASTK